jgi:Flp pilus assembly protein TadB
VDTLTLAIALTVLAFVAVFTMVFAITMPANPNKSPRKAQKDALKLGQLASIQARLDRAQIEVKAESYVRQSLQLGIPIGIALYVLVGAVVLFVVGVVAGFMFTWSKLEQQRDEKQIGYYKQLASACDIITNAYAVRPSLTRAMNAAGEFSSSPLKEDFQEMIVGLRQGDFEQVVLSIGNRRKSIVFDTVANALLRAKDESGQVKDIMEKLATATRQNVGAFEESVSMQINARSSIRWGTYGPWLILAVFRATSMFLAAGSGTAGPFDAANDFFKTFTGNVLALVAALMSMSLYTYGFKLAQRGLVIRRVESEDDLSKATVRAAQGPRSDAGDEAAPKPARWGARPARRAVEIPLSGE